MATIYDLGFKCSDIIQLLFICMLSQQSKGQLESEHEGKKRTDIK
jgi:hypothetical protein